MDFNLKCSECNGDVDKLQHEYVCVKCGRRVSFTNTKKKIIDMGKLKHYDQVLME